MVAALGVWGAATGWPDLIVAGIMASLFLTSAVKILIQARVELRSVAEGHGHSHAHPHWDKASLPCRRRRFPLETRRPPRV